jgi:hypothetical protein
MREASLNGMELCRQQAIGITRYPLQEWIGMPYPHILYSMLAFFKMILKGFLPVCNQLETDVINRYSRLTGELTDITYSADRPAALARDSDVPPNIRNYSMAKAFDQAVLQCTRMLANFDLLEEFGQDGQFACPLMMYKWLKQATVQFDVLIFWLKTFLDRQDAGHFYSAYFDLRGQGKKFEVLVDFRALHVLLMGKQERLSSFSWHRVDGEVLCPTAPLDVHFIELLYNLAGVQ